MYICNVKRETTNETFKALLHSYCYSQIVSAFRIQHALTCTPSLF